ncbi:MAG: lipoprotein-releasing ABC transporter permease subunit [Gammaproteobacteria bacterium]|nr:lipoprotein-releasing ABC transporter permease subunit [Gammaproteobacteria bacterium]MCW8911323.1 lipoprotein-releasing ABC transporter permease subunit [Gammaproteobacteria bacterium]MCW9004979.1 lipoprotein-releasing ABC transporter permease subunit [Gammaproteobacteria bacterium]MCW9055727.1 lipoprotein-releasing ABC transporter permease subunit [Gammaproteobacteria bacterium]
MFRPKELYIGLRYTRAKRRSGFVSFIAMISMLGIALGVAALIVVLSVMNGFGKELRERTLGMTAHATISGYNGYLTDWTPIQNKAAAYPHVIDSAPYTQAEAMLSNSGRVSGAIIRGILPAEEPGVSEIADKMVSGTLDQLQPGHYGIILGRELANALGVYEGDKITVITPQANVTPVGVMPRLRRFTVTGVFEAGMHQFDRSMALIHINDAQKLFSLGEQINGLRLKFDDMFNARLIAYEIQQQMGDDYWVKDWTNMHSNLFKALKTEKVVMFIILLLIVAVAAFNIISTLVMTVTDKQADIAILRTLGMTPGSLMVIFIIQGMIIGLIGTLLGVSAGVPIALNVNEIVTTVEQFFNTKFLPADVYYITEIRADIHVKDVVVYSVSAFLLSVLATIYPAWRAAKVEPADALRYE